MTEAAGLRLDTRAPFHLEATVRVLQRRPTNPVDVLEGGCYRRVIATAGGLVLVEVTNLGSIDAPRLRARLVHGASSPATRAALRRTLRDVLGLDVDPEPLQRRLAAEPRLATIAAGLRGMRPPRFAALFEAFASIVPFQQVSLDAGVAIMRRLVDRFGESLDHEGRRYRAFPTAHVIASARLDAIAECGMSRRKAETLHRVARAIEGGELTEAALARTRTADAIHRLSELPGIGPWTASVVLLRGLRRLDTFPAGDVGAARGLHVLTRLAPRPLERMIERFGEERGYLYFCALGGALLARGLITPAPQQAQPKNCQ